MLKKRDNDFDDDKDELMSQLNAEKNKLQEAHNQNKSI